MAVSVTVGDVVAVLGLGVLLVVNAAIASIAIRFFRIRFAAGWAIALYAAIAIPICYAATSLALLGALGIGTGVSLDRDALLFFAWGLPLAFGASIELFWMPPPAAFDGPEQPE